MGSIAALLQEPAGIGPGYSFLVTEACVILSEEWGFLFVDVFLLSNCGTEGRELVPILPVFVTLANSLDLSGSVLSSAR